MLRRLLPFALALGIALPGAHAWAYPPRVQAALDAEERGDYAEAYRLWTGLAEEGDVRAAISAGLIDHQGLGRPVDYAKAMAWYLRAFPDNADAINNLGVMHRDGLGVPANRRIAYLAFLTVHMAHMGSEATQIRTNGNLRREIAELPVAERRAALCLSPGYFLAYVRARGDTSLIDPAIVDAMPTQRFRDLGWWAPGEIAPYDCPPVP